MQATEGSLSQRERIAGISHAKYYLKICKAARVTSNSGSPSITLLQINFAQILKSYLWLSTCIPNDSEVNGLCLSYAMAVGNFVKVLLSYGEQLDWYVAALAAAERLHHDGYACQFILSQGTTYLSMGEIDRAEELLKMGFEKAQHTNDPGIAAVAHSDLGHLFLYQGDIETARELLETSIRLIQSVRDPLQRGPLLSIEAANLSDLAQLYSRLGKHHKAVRFAKRAQRIGGTPSVAGLLGDIYMHWFTLSNPSAIKLSWQAAIFRINAGKLYRATRYLEEDLVLSRQDRNLSNECCCLSTLGVINYLLMRVDKGIQCLTQALAIAIEMESPGAQATCLTQLGTGYNALGDFRRAVECHQKGAALAHDAGDRQAEGNALHNLSQALHNLGDDLQARVHAETALKILEEVHSPVAQKTRRLLGSL